MSHHTTEHVLRNFFPALRFLTGSCIKLLSVIYANFLRLLFSQIDVLIMLLSTFCVVELWPLIFQLKIASCYWACFAQFFSCSSFPIRKLYKATDHVLRKFSPTPLSRNWFCIIPQSTFCAIFSCSSLSYRKLHQATEHNLRKFSSPPLFPNWCRIMLLRTLRSWIVTADFSTKNCVVLLSMFCAIFFLLLISY